MGCDAYANDEGVFEIAVWDYENVNGVEFEKRLIRIEGLKPNHRIGVEVTEGEER